MRSEAAGEPPAPSDAGAAAPEPKPAVRQTLLFYTASSTDSPHRAALPLLFAVTAKEQGQDAEIFLAGDATLLMKDTVAADIKAVGQPGAAELLRRAVDLKIPIYI